ncbi:MAG TPA: exodeoxyribonuclease VII small subunit [Chroococcidiopsis sp.]
MNDSFDPTRSPDPSDPDEERDPSDRDSVSPTAPSSPGRPWNYETSVAEVEAIITRIEMGDLDLAEVFDQFTHAVKHLQQCEHFLNNQKHQMDVLIETLMDEPDF